MHHRTFSDAGFARTRRRFAAQMKTAVTSEDQSAGDALIDTSVGEQGNVAGGPALIGLKHATSTTTQLAAGHYGMRCFVPAASDGQPHAAHGMIEILDVKGAKSSAKPPSSGLTDVTLNDTSITFPLTNPGRKLAAEDHERGHDTAQLHDLQDQRGQDPCRREGVLRRLLQRAAPSG